MFIPSGLSGFTSAWSFFRPGRLLPSLVSSCLVNLPLAARCSGLLVTLARLSLPAHLFGCLLPTYSSLPAHLLPASSSLDRLLVCLLPPPPPRSIISACLSVCCPLDRPLLDRPLLDRPFPACLLYPLIWSLLAPIILPASSILSANSLISCLSTWCFLPA